MLLIIPFLAICFLAYANWRQRQFQGRCLSLWQPYVWRSHCYHLGNGHYLRRRDLSDISCANPLKKFNAKGIVPDHFSGPEAFVLAVALGAGLTVILATLRLH